MHAEAARGWKEQENEIQPGTDNRGEFAERDGGLPGKEKADKKQRAPGREAAGREGKEGRNGGQQLNISLAADGAAAKHLQANAAPAPGRDQDDCHQQDERLDHRPDRQELQFAIQSVLEDGNEEAHPGQGHPRGAVEEEQAQRGVPREDEPGLVPAQEQRREEQEQHQAADRDGRDIEIRGHEVAEHDRQRQAHAVDQQRAKQ